MVAGVRVLDLEGSIFLYRVRATCFGVVDRTVLNEQHLATATAGQVLAEDAVRTVGDQRLHRPAKHLGHEQSFVAAQSRWRWHPAQTVRGHARPEFARGSVQILER